EGALHLTSQVTGSLLTIIPEADWFGTETLTIVATEGSLISPAAMASLNQFRNLSISAQLVVQVFPINDPPVIHQAFPTVSMYMNQSFTLEGLSSYVSDLDSELLFSFQGNANISLEKLGNSLVITPDQDWIGIRRISVGISDDFDAIVEMDLTVIVRASFLYEEDFDHAGSLPSGWTRTGTAWTAYLQEGTDYAARISNPQLSSTQRLVTSTINLSSIRNPVISFYHELTRPVGLTATLQYSISNGITYYNIENFTASTSGWYSIPVPQLENQANVKLRWHYLSSTVNLNSWLIDDFSISGEYGDFSAPPQVTSLSVSSAGTNFVSLSWNPVEDTFFERYEISVRSDLNIGSQLFVWSVEQDPSLVHSAQNGTVITGLNHLAGYYFFIRAKDLSNNSSPWSDPAFAIASPLPQIQILTGDDVWFNSHNPSLAFRITDDQMVSASSLRYRIDQDLNGSYDESEPWTPVSGYSDAALIEVEIPVTISTDGLNFHYELSCTDTQNPIYAYSGSEYSEGIGDDPTFNVDTGAPQTVSGFVTQAVSPTQVILAWDASLDSAFREYEILYGFSPDPGLESTSWG
ncbi:MAG: hypothetical protein PHI68_03865, partial [Candidatus Cloacimonetes bacterium]|nr:hypothetical protein [Candidatus Cloacimonadota bacterium]